MKATLEIPDDVFREAESAAARRGIPLEQLVAEALADKLKPEQGGDQPWMECFGALRHLREETARINQIIEEEFERIEPEDQA